MKLKKTNYLFFIAGVMLLSACNNDHTLSNKPLVTVSIAPQKYFIEQLTDTLIDVLVMVPSGADHATYSPTTRQMVDVSHSEVYFLMGHLGFEDTWKDKLKSVNERLKFYDLSEGITPIQGEHKHRHQDEKDRLGVDPHTWTSPKLVKKIVYNLKNALIELHPEYEKTIEANYTSFLQKVDELDSSLVQLKQKRPGLTFMIFHPAYTYLAQSYDFKQLSIEFEGKTPTPVRLQKTIEEAKEKGIKTVYIQKEFDINKAETIANAINAKVVQVNPLSENWMAEMKRFITYLEEN